MSDSLRILIDAATDGGRNMAIDEALLHAVGRGLSGPTLRLYRWERATLSLGYSQKLAALADQPLLVRSMPLVRRVTGGGAILHDREMTYCLALPLADASAVGEIFCLAGAAADMYGRMHGFLAQAVDRLGRQGVATRPGFTAARLAGDAAATDTAEGGGATKADAGKPARPTNAADGGCATNMAQGEVRAGAAPAGKAFLCFERHSSLDLMMGGDKLAGSAQRRSKHALIQHGSLVLRSHPAQPSQAVERITGRHITFEEMASALLSVLRAEGLELEHGQLTQSESLLLPDLIEKHQSQAWVSRVV